MEPSPDSRRVTVQEGMRILGISEHAVRMRAKRGSLESEKGDDGRLYVYLPPETTSEASTETAEDTPPDTALVDALQARIESLESSLQAEREANREQRRLLAAALERMPALGSTERPEDAPQSPGEAGQSSAPTGGAQEGPQRPSRSWWRRLIGR